MIWVAWRFSEVTAIRARASGSPPRMPSRSFCHVQHDLGVANGAANTYPLVTLCSALGAKVPTVTVPFAKHDLAGHPAWLASLAVLRRAGIQLIDPSTGAVGAVHPIASGTGEQITQAFQWSWVMDCLDRISGGSSSSPVKQPGDASSS